MGADQLYETGCCPPSGQGNPAGRHAPRASIDLIQTVRQDGARSALKTTKAAIP